jgi:hypothetical protein
MGQTEEKSAENNTYCIGLMEFIELFLVNALFFMAGSGANNNAPPGKGRWQIFDKPYTIVNKIKKDR